MSDPDPRIERRPGLGTVFHSPRFDRSGSDGVAAGFQLTGRGDFPEAGFRCRVERGVQKVFIDPTARTNTDAGIERHFAVSPGDVFRLTAHLRVAQKTGKFKGRVNLSARRRLDGTKVQEFNAAQETVTESVVERVVEGVVPGGAEFLSARVTFHTSAAGESGEGEIHAMRLERIKALSTTPAGTRLSLYNFNIHKMVDDWPGWIRFVREQRLAPPDIVLLQDVEHDADRQVLQRELGAAFGGTWTGRGSDPAWQTAIVWRAGRFSQVSERRWRGYGGTTCVNHSQDAPAIQVKMRDDRANKWVSLVSLKTPPQVHDECVWENIQEVNRSFAPPWAGDLCAIGTDANSPDRADAGHWTRWYRRTIRSESANLTTPESLGFCDPIIEGCGGDMTLMNEHLTLANRRIDFLFLKTAPPRPPSIVRQMTLPRGNASGVKWSDHRSVHAEIAY